MMMAICFFFYPTCGMSVLAAEDTAATEDGAELSAVKSTAKWTKASSGKLKGKYTAYKKGKTVWKIKSTGVLTKNGKTVSLKKYYKKTVKIGDKYFYVKKSGKKYVIDRTKGWKKDKSGKYTYYVAKNGGYPIG